MFRLINFTLIVLMHHIAYAQNSNDFAYYNNETYRLYTELDWTNLKRVGKDAIENGHDFYYLRMRLGIAFYQTGNYVSAARQFKKALDFYPESADARNYLYSCYEFLGRIHESRAFYNVTNEKSKFIRSVYLEPGYKFSDAISPTRDVRYMFIGMNHEFGRRVTLFHGYQRLGADFVTLFAGNGGIGPGSGTFEYPYSIFQNEYYVSMTWLVSKGFHLVPAYHFQYVYGNGFSGTNQAFSFQLIKWLGRVKLYGGYSFAKINREHQQQAELGLLYYPLGNANIFLQFQGTGHTENSTNNFISFNKLGLKVLSKTWLEGFGSVGDMNNFLEMNGYVMYNQLDTITSKWGVGINQYIGKSLIFLQYVHENKIEYTTRADFIHRSVIMGLNLTF